MEGGNFFNDWWRWEQRPGRVEKSASAERAADHYARFQADFDLARKLGHKAHLFSVEWSRVEPEQGRFDDNALAHYADVVDALRVREIEPVCVLQHVTLPTWFADNYGWRHAHAPRFFERYAQHVVDAFQGKCRWWIPLQEPVHTLLMGHGERLWPPGKARPLGLVRALRNMILAHVNAYRVIHNSCPGASVGPAICARICRPLEAESSWDLRTARHEEFWFNNVFLDAVNDGRWPFHPRHLPEAAETADFVGLAYFGRQTLCFDPTRPTRLFGRTTTSDGTPAPAWHFDNYPQGMAKLIHGAQRYGKPIIITANGLATNDDVERCAYLLDHIGVLARCMEDGVDVRGYFHRALLDGFEWNRGYSARYGLIHVDWDSLVRTPNGSAYLYKDACESCTFPPRTAERYVPDWHEDTLEE